MSRPRNPVVRSGGLKRKSGPHGKTRKAQRQADRQALQRDLSRRKDLGSFFAWQTAGSEVRFLDQAIAAIGLR